MAYDLLKMVFLTYLKLMGQMLTFVQYYVRKLWRKMLLLLLPLLLHHDIPGEQYVQRMKQPTHVK